MSGLEQAIRNALERAERSDPDIRARIYQSARNALDVGLRKQEINDLTVVERQRQRLEVTIREIEDEELSRLRSIAQFERVALEREPEEEPERIVEAQQPHSWPVEPPSRSHLSAQQPVSEPLDAEFEDEQPPAIEHVRQSEPARAVRSTERAEPMAEIAAQSRPGAGAGRSESDMDDYLAGLTATREARSAAPAAPPQPAEWDDEAAEAIAPTKKRRRSFASVLASTFVYLFLLSIVGGGVWWVYDTGMIEAAMKGDGDFKLVPDALRSDKKDPAHEEARLDTLRGFSGEWIDIFKPGTNADAAKPRAKAAITEHRDSDGLATVITSNAPDQDGDVLVEVAASLLQDLAGKTSTIAITVKSNSDKPAQIYIQCEFKTLGDCGRHRYTVTNERADELIQVKFDGKMSPSSAGHIVINSDLTGEGSSIRLYGIRVLPGS